MTLEKSAAEGKSLDGGKRSNKTTTQAKEADVQSLKGGENHRLRMKKVKRVAQLPS